MPFDIVFEWKNKTYTATITQDSANGIPIWIATFPKGSRLEFMSDGYHWSALNKEICPELKNTICREIKANRDKWEVPEWLKKIRKG